MQKCCVFITNILLGSAIYCMGIILQLYKLSCKSFSGWGQWFFCCCLSVFLSVSCQQNVSQGSMGPAAAWTARASTTAPATGSRAAANAPRVTTATPVSTVSETTLGSLLQQWWDAGLWSSHVNASPVQLKFLGCPRSPGCFQIRLTCIPLMLGW